MALQQNRGEEREEFLKEGMELNASGVAIMETSWVRMQQKVFTKWCNSQLKRAGKPTIEDLVEDMQTGIPLMNLTQALWPESKMPRYNKNPRMRIHKIDNTSRAIQMLEDVGLKLVGTNNVHLVDKDQKMILGLIWIIISSYQILGISEEDLNAKDALLLWCKKKTRGYKDVDVRNFTSSWCDGLALCALIHRHRPDLIDFDSLSPENRIENLNLAFRVAEEHLDIDPLLDAEDVADEAGADERSMVTYLSAFYHAFAGMGQLEDASRRISNVIELDRKNAALQAKYETDAAALAAWIAEKQAFHENRDFPDDEEAIKGLLLDYGHYKSGDKADKTREKAELESGYNQLQTSLAMNNRPPYVPEAGLSPVEIQNGWTGLGNEETEYVSALRKKLNHLQQSDILLKRWRTKSKKFLLRAELLEEECALVLDEAIATDHLAVITQCNESFAALRDEQRDIEGSKPELENLVEEIHAMGLEETRYTENTLDTVNSTWDTTSAAIDELETKLAAEAEHETSRDHVRKQFAELADPAYEWVRNKADEIVAPATPRSSNIDAELERCSEHLHDIASFDMHPLEAAHEAMNAMGVITNEYTEHNYEEIVALHEGLGPALEDKMHLLSNQKIAESGHKVTPEQMAEFQQTFAHFDRDHSRTLSALQLKSCMAALGHVLSDSDAASVISEHGKDNSISFDAFLPYILSLVEDSDSAPQIIESFRAIAGGADTVTEAQLRTTLPSADVDYIVQNFPAGPDGSIDYTAGTNQIYSK